MWEQLTELVCDIAASLDQGKKLEARGLDFSKALDKVNNKKLLYKLVSYWVRYRLIEWIDGFLSSRTQRVVIAVEESWETSVSSGVPQGYVIEPTMFSFYINYLPDNLKSFIRHFSDDAIAYNSASNQIISLFKTISQSWNNGSICGTWSFTPFKMRAHGLFTEETINW